MVSSWSGVSLSGVESRLDRELVQTEVDREEGGLEREREPTEDDC